LKAATRRRPSSWEALENFRRAGYLLLMPIYEFHCDKCERDSEILVRSSDWKAAACPHCGSKKLTKKFSTFASAGAGENHSKGNGGGGHCCGGGCHCH